MNKKLTFAIICLTAFAGYFFWPKSNSVAQHGPAPTKPIDVTVITLTKKIVRPTIELPGRVNAQKISQVRPQIDGIVKEIKFVEGSFVEKGQQLYQIDPDIYKSAFNAATSTAKSLKDKRDRYEVLIRVDAVSKQEFSDAEAELAKAQSDVSKAKKNLEYTKVLAPISGFIGKTNITEGALVTTNQTNALTTIAQVDPIYVDLEQPSKNLIPATSTEDISVNLTTDDPTYHNVGQLKFREMFADETTDSVRLRAIFNNADQKLLPGMFVTAKLDLAPFEAITVPQRIASRGPNGGLMVWIVNQDGSASPRPIKAEKISGDSWIVEDGLNEGEKVVYEGFTKLREGAKVNASEFTPKQKNTSEAK